MTLLGKIVGVYKIGFKNGATGAGLKMDVLIIENLFYEKKIDKSYDLKVIIPLIKRTQHRKRFAFLFLFVVDLGSDLVDMGKDLLLQT